MKNILVLIVTFLIVFNLNVYASTNTYERTEENLQISDSIKITESVKKAALATPRVDASEKIYDFADLFSDSEELNLYDEAIDFIEDNQMDMVIVTINENNKTSSQAYADDFYDYNDFGVGSNFDGLLFLIDMDERMMYISTTGKAISIYTDYRIERMLDDAYNYISNEQYYETASSFINSAYKYAKIGVGNNQLPAVDGSDYNSDVDYDYIDFIEYMEKETDSSDTWVIISSIILSTVIIVIAASRHRTVKKATHAREYLINGSFKLTNKTDRFITSNTTKVYVPPASSSSGGGASTHRSSSGRSHGGGGRKF